MSDFADSIEDLRNESPAEEKAALLRRERDRLKSQLGQVHAEMADLRRMLDFHDVVGQAKMDPPKWMAPAKAKGNRKAIVCAILSDCHFDEVVRPEEIGGINCYNRAIATMRLEKWAHGVIEQSRDYLSGLDYEGAVVALGGDIFSGSIHDELKETNEDTIFGSMLYWSEQICAALTVIVDHFGKLHVPVVVGNHGRMTRKSRAKLRARDNLDWFLGHMVRRYFENDPRVTVDVKDDPDCFFRVYDCNHLLTHGDQVKGGGGVGGIWPPIMRMKARKAERYALTPFDVVVMGHWHQLILAPTQGLIINGSTKGYDEFSSIMNFRPERAQQAMWIVTPENKITWTTGIFCDDRSREGW